MGLIEELLLKQSHIQVHYNQCLPSPQAELKTKTNPNGQHSNPNGQHFCGRLDSFWFSTRFTRKKLIHLARKTNKGAGGSQSCLKKLDFFLIWKNVLRNICSKLGGNRGFISREEGVFGSFFTLLEHQWYKSKIFNQQSRIYQFHILKFTYLITQF